MSSDVLDPLSRALVTTQDEVGKLRAELDSQKRMSDLLTQKLETARSLMISYIVTENALGLDDSFILNHEAMRAALAEMTRCYAYYLYDPATHTGHYSSKCHQRGLVDPALAASFKALGWSDPCPRDEAK